MSVSVHIIIMGERDEEEHFDIIVVVFVVVVVVADAVMRIFLAPVDL